MTSTQRRPRVLKLMAEDPTELGVSEIANLLATPRAYAHCVCSTLVEAGLIESDVVIKRFRLTAKALWMGSGYAKHSASFRAPFFPILNLTNELHSTVQRRVVSDFPVWFIYSMGYPGATADVELREPLHATAYGRLLLTQMASAELDKELQEVLTKEYAVNNKELLPGYVVPAAPELHSTGQYVAAIRATLSLADMHGREGSFMVGAIIAAARKTSLQPGYPPHGGTVYPWE